MNIERTKLSASNSEREFPIMGVEAVPVLTTQEMIEVDRLMTDVLGIRLIQMMENAGRNLARFSVARFLYTLENRHVVVMAGNGGNGGGALVAARRLHQWGAAVRVLISRPDSDFADVPRHQLDILRRLGISVDETGLPDASPAPDLILDGLIGYSLNGNPRNRSADLIHWANSNRAPIVALDTPSGLDTSSGTAFEPTIVASATMTLALPKAGLNGDGAKNYVGDLFVADIGVPDSVYKKLGLTLPISSMFTDSDIIQLN